MNTIENLIKKGQVTIFSKTYCPFCVKIKNYFQSIDVKYTAYEVDKGEINNEQVNDLHAKTGCKTYPNVFIGLVNTKGCSETLALVNSGKLFDIMNENDVTYKKN